MCITLLFIMRHSLTIPSNWVMFLLFSNLLEITPSGFHFEAVSTQISVQTRTNSPPPVLTQRSKCGILGDD